MREVNAKHIYFIQLGCLVEGMEIVMWLNKSTNGVGFTAMEGVIKTTLPRQCGEVVELSGLQFSGNPDVYYITKSALNSQNNFCRNKLNKLASFKNFFDSMELLTNILYIFHHLQYRYWKLF